VQVERVDGPTGYVVLSRTIPGLAPQRDIEVRAPDELTSRTSQFQDDAASSQLNAGVDNSSAEASPAQAQGSRVFLEEE
jgi:hypothetical protein